MCQRWLFPGEAVARGGGKCAITRRSEPIRGVVFLSATALAFFAASVRPSVRPTVTLDL